MLKETLAVAPSISPLNTFTLGDISFSPRLNVDFIVVQTRQVYKVTGT